MVRRIRPLVLVITVLIVFGQTSTSASGLYRHDDIVQIRIDSNGRHWWNIGWVSPDNLPKLQPPQPESSGEGSFAVNTGLLYDLLYERLASNVRTRVLITVHPNAHYVWVNNLLTIVEQAQVAADPEYAAIFEKPVDSLTEIDLMKIPYSIRTWRERDRKILNWVCQQMDIEPCDTDPVPKNYSFATQLELGRWDYLKDKVHDWNKGKSPIGIKPVGINDEDDLLLDPPIVLRQQPVDLGHIADGNRLEFSIPVKIRILANGHVADAAVVESSGVQSLDERAVAAASQWLFLPRTYNGQAIECCTTITIQHPPEIGSGE